MSTKRLSSDFEICLQFAFIFLYLIYLISSHTILYHPNFLSYFLSPPYLDNHGNKDIPISQSTGTHTFTHACTHTLLITFLDFFPDLMTCNDTAATLINQSTCGTTQVLSGAATSLIKPSDAFPVLVCIFVFYFLHQLVPAFLRVREGAGALLECLCCMCT